MAVSNKSTARKVEEEQTKQVGKSRTSAKKTTAKSTGRGRKADKKA